MSASECPGQDRDRVFVVFVHTTFIQCLPAACSFSAVRSFGAGCQG